MRLFLSFSWEARWKVPASTTSSSSASASSLRCWAFVLRLFPPPPCGRSDIAAVLCRWRLAGCCCFGAAVRLLACALLGTRARLARGVHVACGRGFQSAPAEQLELSQRTAALVGRGLARAHRRFDKLLPAEIRSRASSSTLRRAPAMRGRWAQEAGVKSVRPGHPWNRPAGRRRLRSEDGPGGGSPRRPSGAKRTSTSLTTLPACHFRGAWSRATRC